MNITEKKDILLEYMRCSQSPAYAIPRYFVTFDKTQEKYVTFDLFDGQVGLVENYGKHRYNLVLKYRQAGITTVTSGYCAIKTAFASPDNPEKVLILANKQETAIEFLTKITDFVKQLPSWVNVGFVKDSQKHVKLSNGSEIKAVATSPDAMRGYTPTILILDEAAFIEGGPDLWSACMAAVSTGGNIILISTPKGLDEIYYKTYENSLNGNNEFHITSLKWFNDPRYTKDLKFIKTPDIIDWMQKPPDERSEEVIEGGINLTKEERAELIENGYKPHSIWYENMCRGMNLNKRTISQELEANFVGSGDNVIHGDVIAKQAQQNMKEPIYKDKDWDNGLWIWKYPEEGHRYILAIDPSRGDAEDFTGMTIIDFDTNEQVVEYHGKIPQDLAAHLIYKYGMMYNALCTFDITGGIGLVTIQKLRELNFPKKLYHYDNLDEDELYFIPDNDRTPGINFAKKDRRIQIVAALEEAVSRGDFKVRSERLLAEMRKFIYRNGKPDHAKGSHDDLLMALAMCLFVANTSFKKLMVSDNLTKSMLDSWKIKTNTVETKSSLLLEKIVSTPNPDQIYEKETHEEILRNTRDFCWVFGNINKHRPKEN